MDFEIKILDKEDVGKYRNNEIDERQLSELGTCVFSAHKGWEFVRHFKLSGFCSEIMAVDWFTLMDILMPLYTVFDKVENLLNSDNPIEGLAYLGFESWYNENFGCWYNVSYPMAAKFFSELIEVRDIIEEAFNNSDKEVWGIMYY